MADPRGEAPEGYSKMADIELTVDENWTAPEIIRCVNIPNKFWFFKSDNHKNALPGVTFALEDDRGNFLRELVSGEDGVVHGKILRPAPMSSVNWSRRMVTHEQTKPLSLPSTKPIRYLQSSNGWSTIPAFQPA